MNVSFNAASSAYAAAARVRDTAPAAPAGKSAGFADLVKEAAQSTVQTLKQGEVASMQGVLGKADISQVVSAVNNAEMSLQAAVAVRDKVIQSYLDIIRMPI